MAGTEQEKITWHILILGNFINKRFQKAIKKKADELGVSGVSRLEIILEGDKSSATEIVRWLLKKHLAGVVHCEGDMKEFANEFKGKEFRIA